MSVTFPIFRLPFVVQDILLKVMDPQEQFVLCRASKKFKSRIRKLFKKPTFNIKFNDQEKTITFGPGDKKSVINLVLIKKPDGREKKVYDSKDGEPVVYCKYIHSAYTVKYNDFIEIFDIKTAVCVHPEAWSTPVTDPFNFGITETKNGESITTRSRCRNESEEIWGKLATSIPSPNDTRLEFINESAEWMSLDNAMLTMHSISLTDIKVTNEDINRFLKKWKDLVEVKLSLMILKVHHDFSSQVDTSAIADGLDAERTDVDTGSYGSVFEIEREDGRHGRFYYISDISVLQFYARGI